MTGSARTLHWDIFCRVVDNFGDAAVCWRLARQLAAQHAAQVRLWIDRVHTLEQLEPAIVPAAERQEIAGVDIRRWGESLAQFDPGDVVLETFGCRLPAEVLQAMAGQSRPPLWINLEYLSAEPWVDGFHLLPSPHATLPIACWFFFPGFRAATGGLLRERDTAARRAAIQADPPRLFAAIGVDAPVPGEIALSLFCYDVAPVARLLDVLAEGPAPSVCVVPEGAAARAARDWAGLAGSGGHASEGGTSGGGNSGSGYSRSGHSEGERPARASVRRGRLRLEIVPFLHPLKYDELLFACDVNFVRGEDSFVRAHWARRPLVWQPYPTADGAHLVKLAAWLGLWRTSLAAAVGEASERVSALARAWNGAGADLAPAWRAALAVQDEWRHAMQGFAAELEGRPDLAASLDSWVRSRI